MGKQGPPLHCQLGVEAQGSTGPSWTPEVVGLLFTAGCGWEFASALGQKWCSLSGWAAWRSSWLLLWQPHWHVAADIRGPHYCQAVGVSRRPIRPPSTLSPGVGWGKGTPLVTDGCLLTSTDSTGGGLIISQGYGWMSWLSILPFLTPCWQREWGSWYKPPKGRDLVLPLAGVEMGPQICCSGWLEKSNYCLRGFHLARLLLWLERAGSGWGFFCLCSLAFPSCQLLQLQVWDTWGKKENTGNSGSYGSLDSESLVSLPSLHPSEPSCFTYCFT